MTSLADLGEFALIRRLTEGLEVPSGWLGPGDDCAVALPTGAVVISTDTMVQGVHWKDSWSPPEAVGRKLVAAAAADLEAMGAAPLGVVIALAAPSTTPVIWLEQLMAGVRAECGNARLALLGGDTTRSELVVLTATVIGDLEGREAVQRSGARPGDVVAMCGRLGWAAAGLAVLNRGFRSPAAVVNAHRVPQVPYGQGVAAAVAGATSLIDVSDGLVADLGHVAAASGVRIDITTAALEVEEPQRVVAAAIGGKDPLEFVLTGGDDHALVGTFAGAVPLGWREIGTVLAGDPGVSIDQQVWDGDTAAGWSHFS